MPLRAEAALVAAVVLASCSGSPDATWRVPPTYADAPPPAVAPPASDIGKLSPDESYAAPVEAPAAEVAAPLPTEAGAPSGPVGTSGSGAPLGYDHVGYASWYGEEMAGRPTASGTPFDPAGPTAAHRTLPLGSFAEVTALDTGRTILVQITDRGPSRGDREIDLSRGAAQALGVDGRAVAGVRVRAVVPSPGDIAALRGGQFASARLDTPEPVLRALRRQLGGAPAVASAPAVRQAPSTKPPITSTRAGAGYAAPSAAAAKSNGGFPPFAPPPSHWVNAAPAREVPTSAPPATARTGFVVQVAAFSSEERARNLARSLHGSAVPGEGLWRVRLGPYRDMAQAQAARDAAVQRGYGDAAIMIAP